jgi:prepilin-type processing-associated H-X9-DG protein
VRVRWEILLVHAEGNVVDVLFADGHDSVLFFAVINAHMVVFFSPFLVISCSENMIKQ